MKLPISLRRRDWRFVASKYIINRRYEHGLVTTFDTNFDHSEDFSREIILQKGHVFVDAGCNAGMWTLPASKYYDQVVAIDPSPRAIRSLRKNLEMNRIENVWIHEAALSSENGMANLYVIPGRQLGNSVLDDPIDFFDTTEYTKGRKKITVLKTTLDSLRLQPTLIKLDVEGSELEAVQGGLKTIAEHHPILLVEIHRRENEDAIRNLLPEYSWTTRYREMPEFTQPHLLGVYKS